MSFVVFYTDVHTYVAVKYYELAWLCCSRRFAVYQSNQTRESSHVPLNCYAATNFLKWLSGWHIQAS